MKPLPVPKKMVDEFTQTDAGLVASRLETQSSQKTKIGQSMVPISASSKKSTGVPEAPPENQSSNAAEGEDKERNEAKLGGFLWFPLSDDGINEHPASNHEPPKASFPKKPRSPPRNPHFKAPPEISGKSMPFWKDESTKENVSPQPSSASVSPAKRRTNSEMIQLGALTPVSPIPHPFTLLESQNSSQNVQSTIGRGNGSSEPPLPPPVLSSQSRSEDVPPRSEILAICEQFLQSDVLSSLDLEILDDKIPLI